MVMVMSDLFCFLKKWKSAKNVTSMTVQHVFLLWVKMLVRNIFKQCAQENVLNPKDMWKTLETLNRQIS
jgi:hypothetical protein